MALYFILEAMEQYLDIIIEGAGDPEIFFGKLVNYGLFLYTG